MKCVWQSSITVVLIKSKHTSSHWIKEKEEFAYSSTHVEGVKRFLKAVELG